MGEASVRGDVLNGWGWVGLCYVGAAVDGGVVIGGDGLHVEDMTSSKVVCVGGWVRGAK